MVTSRFESLIERTAGSGVAGLSSNRLGLQAFTLKIRVRVPLTLFSRSVGFVPRRLRCSSAPAATAPRRLAFAVRSFPSGRSVGFVRLRNRCDHLLQQRPCFGTHSAVAQLVERSAVNRNVTGSIPVCGAILVLSFSGPGRRVVSAEIGGSSPLSTAMRKIVQWQDAGLWGQLHGFDSRSFSQIRPRRDATKMQSRLLGSVGEQLNHLPVKQPRRKAFAGASPAAPKLFRGRLRAGHDALNVRMVVRIHPSEPIKTFFRRNAFNSDTAVDESKRGTGASQISSCALEEQVLKTQ